MAQILRGQLLISRPVVKDPNFTRTVIYMIEHTDEGSAGVVLNRPSDIPVAEILEPWARLATDPRVVFLGGPVGTDAAVCLGEARTGHEPSGWSEISEGIGLIDLDMGIEIAIRSVRRMRIFVGYAGWSSGQLESEIESDGWFIAGALNDDVFSHDPKLLFRDVMRRQRGDAALMATFPDDPELN